MLNKQATKFFVITIVLVAVSGLLFLFRWLFFANISPNSPEGQEITAALQQAYAVLDIPFDQLELAQLSKVLINHPYYLEQLSAEEIESLKQYTMRIQGKEALNDFGYLTSMRTKCMHQQHGAELLKAAKAKASEEKREITPDEFKKLKEMNYGRDPWIPGHEPFQRKLRYFSITIEKDKAMVKYDEGVTGRTAVLVKVEGRWYVAGIF